MHGIQGSKSIYWRHFLQMKPLRTFFNSRTNTTSSRFSSTSDDTSSVDCVTSVRVAGRRLTEFCFIWDWWSVTTDWGHWEMFSFVGRAKYLLRRWRTAGTSCPCLPQPRETPCYNKLNHECNIIVDCKSVLKKQLRKGFCIVSLRGTGRSHLYDYSLLTYKIDLDSNVHTWNPILYFDIPHFMCSRNALNDVFPPLCIPCAPRLVTWATHRDVNDSQGRWGTIRKSWYKAEEKGPSAR